ncbi:MAG: LPXTG cell wall anchor domain-containing protein [Clostridia bacterium]|nr:LPXTG cell wall anchor domain-containing protein [Clostridia bacterium]
MESVNNIYLDKHKKFRIDTKKLAIFFLAAAFIVAIVVFWWLKLVGITVTGEAFCGLDEHTHGEDCYISELVCGFDETEPTVLTSESDSTEPSFTEAETTENSTGYITNAAEEPEENPSEITTSEAVTAYNHRHTDECYTKVMVCTINEHTHSQECFPDKTADVETVSDWLDIIEDVEITNNIPENLIAVAMTQLDYEESNNNFEYDDDGDKNGYTRYGEWYGNPYGKWNTMFVSFCLHYSNINNDSELKASGAEALRIVWDDRGVYSPADEHTPERGDIVFIDNDNDGTADATAIIIAPGETGHVVIMGDSNNRVETLSIDVSEDIIGYGLTGELGFARDMENESNEKEATQQTTAPEETTQKVFPPLMMMAAAPSEEDHTIKYITDLTEAVTDVHFKTQDGNEISENGTVYIGQNYIVALTFSETNTGKEWLQFQHGNDHYLVYPIPANMHCDPFYDPHPITAKMENGTIQNVGEYFVDENGMLHVRFIDVEDGVCFGQKYSNVEFTIDFNVTIGANQSGTSTDIIFNDKINVEFNIDGGAGMTVNKAHGEYDEDNHTMDYTIKVEATHGVVKDLVIDDQIWENHYALRDTIVVTDLEGKIIDPQPTVSNHPSHNYGANEGFRISDFPDFPAGEGFLITYKTQIYDEMLGNETVDMWNGLDSNGKDSNGENIYVWADDWTQVELEKMEKEGRQTVLENKNGEQVPVIEWEVVIKKDNHNLQGTVIIDTLGEGLEYYRDYPITVKHYNEEGKNLNDIYIDWDDVTVNGNTMEFALPDGYQFDIIYYTTYEKLDTGDTQSYNNEVKATINGKEETAGGVADVVGFVPKVSKSARGDDGEYIYFTIEADVPGVIKDRGSFFLTDQTAFWGYKGNTEGYLYVENMPEDLVITAVTESGTVNFTPYVAGGPTENTYILVYPVEGNQYHSFNIYFNTSSADSESSKWILNEDAKLTVSYKLPFNAKTGVNWTGELQGDKTVEDVLLEKYTLSNAAYLNYTDVIQAIGAATYKYSPMITKKSAVNKDGTIDYTVTFYNSIPGSEGPLGYLKSAKSIVFTDTFDEKLEYVEGSLSVDCYSPWNEDIWFNTYVFEGSVSGNTINVSSQDLKYSKTNETLDAKMLSWLRDWMKTYQVYCNEIAGGRHVFTYKLKLKDEYLYSTENNKYVLDNTAELLWDDDNTSGPVTSSTEFETGLVDKQVAQDGNKLNFSIEINEYSLDILENMDTLTITDTMTPNLSVYWNSIKLYYKDKITSKWISFDDINSLYSCTVRYDQDSNTLTFTVPDELHIRVDYSTLITENGLVSVENTVSINGSAELTDLINATFKVQDHSGGATGSMHEITLIKQDGDTDDRLPGVSFHLYGPMGDPSAVLPAGVNKTIYTASNEALQYIGTYVTGADGATLIKTQYLTQGGPYALVEVSPPEGYMALGKPVYFYFYEPDPNGVIQTVTTLIAVENYSYGFVLPETGGTGTLPLATIGISLMAFPVLYSTIRRKRERRLT